MKALPSSTASQIRTACVQFQQDIVRLYIDHISSEASEDRNGEYGEPANVRVYKRFCKFWTYLGCMLLLKNSAEALETEPILFGCPDCGALQKRQQRRSGKMFSDIYLRKHSVGMAYFKKNKPICGGSDIPLHCCPTI